LSGGGTVTNEYFDSTTLTVGANDATSTFAGVIKSGALGATIGLTKVGAGTLTLSGNNTYAGGTVVNGGTLVAANADALGAGGLTVNDTGTARAQAGLPKALSIASVTTAGSGHLDITDNAMVVRGSTPAAVTALITSGFNGGAWTGPGINSSTAAADANGLTAIGYAANSDYGASDFHGVTGLTASDVLVRFTYYGDADLSGDVTLDDFTQFLNGYQSQTPATNNWLNGDFDYSGTVTLDDFSQFLYGYQNQGAPLSALEAMINSAPGLSSADRAMMLAAVEAVPEPGSFAALALAGASALLAGRRRRSLPRQAGA
jgi:autotransporter-associated beta strand protein